MMRPNKSGFTLPELSLATAFISILLIAIATVTVNLTVVFQKGIAIKNVNDTGRELINEFTQTIAKSNYSFFYGKGLPSTAFYRQYPAASTVMSSGNGPYYGVFCDGSHSYIWNTGYALKSSNSSYRAVLTLDSGEVLNDIHLVRVDDSEAAVCRSNSSGNTFKGGANYLELLPDSVGGLVLYDFKVSTPAFDENSGHAFYSGSFVLGTYDGNVSIRANNFGHCTDKPDGLDTDFAYCSINKFNFAVRATGGIL